MACVLLGCGGAAGACPVGGPLGGFGCSVRGVACVLWSASELGGGTSAVDGADWVVAAAEL